MTTKHTPGPWQYGLRDSTDTSAGLCTVWNVPTLPTEDGRGQTWAVISADGPCWAPDAAQREANGRLMAAAPKLLEALRLLVADVAGYEAFERPCHALDVAQAVLAEVDGRS